VSSGGEDRRLRRKRSSADLGINYPGDLLSLAEPIRAAVKVTTVGLDSTWAARLRLGG